jgi:protein-tyrosine phosphatase
MRESPLNLRDCGGHRTEDGRRVRRGMVFRSAAPEGVGRPERRMLEALQLRTIVDLRPHTESRTGSPALPAIRRVVVPFDLDSMTRDRIGPLMYRRGRHEAIRTALVSIYREMPGIVATSMGEVIRLLLSPGVTPALIHCRAGKDRTGFACAILLRALGVPTAAIVEDYLLTNRSILPRVRRGTLPLRIITLGRFPIENFDAAFGADERYLRSALDHVHSAFGGVGGYLAACGVRTEEVEALRNLLLE